MYVEVCILYLFTSTFALLFDATGILYNLFGPRSIDVRHFDVGAGIRSFAKELVQDNDPCTMNFAFEGGYDEEEGPSQSKKYNLRTSFFDQESFLEGIDYDISASVKQSGHN